MHATKKFVTFGAHHVRIWKLCQQTCAEFGSIQIRGLAASFKYTFTIVLQKHLRCQKSSLLQLRLLA